MEKKEVKIKLSEEQKKKLLGSIKSKHAKTYTDKAGITVVELEEDAAVALDVNLFCDHQC